MMKTVLWLVSNRFDFPLCRITKQEKMRLLNKLLAIALLVAVLLAPSSHSFAQTTHWSGRCDKMLEALGRIAPGSPAYARSLKAIEASGCGQALDYAALVALYHSTNGESWSDNTGWLTDDHTARGTV
jgi:hypothetical protein